jgi:glycine/D-amino acid oxidase-like deaminating enzyme
VATGRGTIAADAVVNAAGAWAREVAAGDPADPFATSVDLAWIDAVVATARARVPTLRDVPVDRAAAWAGLYEVSPDKHAILGPAAECPNFWLANGSSGHGVMHAPALGQLLAEMILSGDRGPGAPLGAAAPGRSEAPEPGSEASYYRWRSPRHLPLGGTFYPEVPPPAIAGWWRFFAWGIIGPRHDTILS